MRKKTYNHTHRYEKRVIGKKGYTVFVCNMPDCNHYISEALVRGKRSICNRCGADMLMDTRAMNLVKPHCADCIHIKNNDIHDKLLELIEGEEKVEST